ncbi:tripartite tricarboxylate transporter substrate binding protein [soil metagenome]
MNPLMSRLGAALALATFCLASPAQDAFPNKPIRVIIPSTPGGGTDFIGRTISQRVTEGSGWSMVPENRAGAAGTLGLAETARAKPDGYDIVVGQTASVALAPWLMKLPFDPAHDLTPVAWAVEAATVLTVAVDSPFKTWDDFIKAAKADPGKPMSFGTSGVGSVAQVTGEVLQEASGFKMQHIAYKGSAPAITDLMGGHVQLAGTSVASALPLLKGGKIRALAVTSLKRSQALPDVPALSELGYAKFNMVEWYGVFGPGKLPPAIADRLHDEINKALQRPEVRQAILEQGQEPRIETRAAFATMVDADIKRSKEIISKAGIKLE